MVSRICRLIVKRKGMEVSYSTRHPALVVWMSFCIQELRSPAGLTLRLRTPGCESQEAGQEKGQERHQKRQIGTAQAYLAGVSVLVGGAALVTVPPGSSGRSIRMSI
jgi:hypothetical protein